MHCRDGSANWDRKVPSFSSTLLDEIYRSIDQGTVKKDDCGRVRMMKQREERDAAVQIRTTRLQEKTKKVSDDVRPKKYASPEKSRLHYVDNDPLFFSSGSNSSDSNSSLFSELDSVPPLPTVKTRSSCFLPPKPIRTSTVKPEKLADENGDVPETAKSRALKMYAHLKKMRQPISPGVKLTSFINSILSNSNKKPSNKATKTSAAAKPTCYSARSRLNHQATPSSTRTSSVNAEPVLTRIKKQRDAQEQPRRHLLVLDSKRTGRKSSSGNVPIKADNAVRVSEDEDYAESDCSEDLFEIDHLKPSINGDLPVYETTRVALKNSN